MSAAPSDPAAARRVRLVLCLICFACLGLYLYPLLCPQLAQDDFQILVRGATWRRTVDNFWVPQNEHAMPLGRLLTFALVQVGGRATLLPWTAGLVGPLALLAALPLLYRFVGRELGHPLYGLVAAALFGVSSVYQQAVFWFAASFSILALDMMLLGLLAAQRWKQTGAGRWLALAALACFLAPCWFASGVLAGPLCALYLFTSPERQRREDAPSLALRAGRALLPLLGTALFLAVSLPQTAPYLQRLKHHGDRTLFEAMGVGLVYTLRSIVDNLLIGVAGVGTVETPIPLVIVTLLLLAAAAWWWWRQAPDRCLLWLGLGMIASGYLLVYSARAEFPYEGTMTYPNWSRYHLLPQLGLALFVAGGLPAWQGKRIALGPDGLTRRQARALAVLVVVLFLVQAPRAVLGYHVPLPGIERFARNENERQRLVEARRTFREQREELQHIAEVEDRCRAHGLDAAAAQTKLKKLPMPGWFTDDANGWLLLRGSDGVCPLPPEEVRRLLGEP